MNIFQLYATVALMAMTCGNATGQVSELKAGDTISGTIISHVGPFELANVRQYDSNGNVIDIAVTDIKGNFTMRVADPNNRFSAVAGSYYTGVDFVPTKEHMTIKLEPGPKRVYPDKSWTFVPGNYSDVSGLPIIPDDFICGYAVHPMNCGDKKPWYGVFLQKDKKGYMVVLNYGLEGGSDTLRIGNDLAERLSGSVRLAFDKTDEVARKVAEYKKEDEAIKMANEKNNKASDAGIIELTFYDGSDLYALLPGKALFRWNEEIPDRVWNELYHQFDRQLGYDSDPWSWTDYGFGDKYDDGYAVISYANFLRYRYDLETGQAVVEYNDSKMPQGILYIESSITTFGKTFPVTAIEAGALDNCNGLTSVTIPASVTSIGDNAFRYCELNSIELSSTDPISCPVNAFDKSVYKLATLRVPKGWNQKKAAKTSPAWGRFKNVEFY